MNREQSFFVPQNMVDVPSSMKGPVTTIRVNEVYANRGRHNSVSKLTYQESQLTDLQTCVAFELDHAFEMERRQIDPVQTVIEQAIEVVEKADNNSIPVPRGSIRVTSRLRRFSRVLAS